MHYTNPFAMALDVIKHDQSDKPYFDRLVAFTTEYVALSSECKNKADLFALNYVRERTAGITSRLESQIIFNPRH